MDTFRLPVSPAHVATASGLALSSALPGLNGETRGICIASIVGVYVLAESIFASVSRKAPTVPAEIADAAAVEEQAIRDRLRSLGA